MANQQLALIVTIGVNNDERRALERSAHERHLPPIR
jgi:hypothetical protein